MDDLSPVEELSGADSDDDMDEEQHRPRKVKEPFSLERVLLRKCPCKSRRNNVNCFEGLRGERQPLVEWHHHYNQLHKLDQDEALFDLLLEMARAQGIVVGHACVGVRRLNYNVFGHPVCADTWRACFGVGKPRHQALCNAVMEGMLGPPLDLRFLTGVQDRPAPKTGQISTWFSQLYESLAETLPDDDEVQHVDVWNSVSGISVGLPRPCLKFL